MTQFTIQNRDSTNVIEIPVAQHTVLLVEGGFQFLSLSFKIPSSDVSVENVRSGA